MKQPDILIYMSDQHGADYTSWGNMPVDTPVLNEIRALGTSFEAAYTPCPLCVPARMSMMSALLPSKTGVYDNNFTLANTIPCFTHSLVEAGYETVLAGRMHFIGSDQRHGFTKRLAPDITPVSWEKPFQKIIQERGRTVKAFSSSGSTDLVGAGTSIVTEYDQMVMDAVMEYLQEKHEKPQFILVGTFGPHCPYITNEELYIKYLKRVEMCEHFRNERLEESAKQNEILAKRQAQKVISKEAANACLASYLAQIEVMDGQIGEIRKAFKDYTDSKKSQSIFGYASDHGDMAGERKLFGKQCYFDKASKVPLLFEGDGIEIGKTIKNPVSLMDVGPTVCDLAGTSFSVGDGRSLNAYLCNDSSNQKDLMGLSERMIVSQMMDQNHGSACASVMLRYRKYKFVLYHGMKAQAVLYDMEENPEETINLVDKLPKLAKWFFEQAESMVDFDEMEQQYERNCRSAKWFQAYDMVVGYDDSERWKDNSEAAKGVLTIAAVDRIELPGRGW